MRRSAAGAPRRTVQTLETIVIIAPMRREDIPEVVAIEGMCFPSRWQAGAYENELTNPKSFYYVAVGPSRVVGFTGMWTSDEEAHVTTCATHPEMRRRGIGHRLLRALLYKAHDLRADRVTLEVRAGNEPAISLYAKQGFARVAYIPRYYSDTGEDGVIMWLKPVILPDDAQRERLVALKSVHDTMLAESYLKRAAVAHRIIPKPPTIAADCGLAITFERRCEAAVMGVLRDRGLRASIVAAVDL